MYEWLNFPFEDSLYKSLTHTIQVKSCRVTNNKLEIEMFCVFYVDMESSTFNIAGLHPDSYAFYYTAFYDILSDIALQFGGRVIKHVGDALIIYFPATSELANRNAFKSTLDCGIAMLESQDAINNAFQKENLPPLHYRISADYGRMEAIETATSPTLDWIGPSMNMVAKMNRLAPANTMIIGGDLHQILSNLSLQEYLFEFSGEMNIGIKQKYPLYTVAKTMVTHGMISSEVADNYAPRTIRLPNGRPEATAPAGLPNIVIVDDEHDILLVYKRYLSSQPVNVEVFADPVQLLGRLAEVGPSYYDLAILDVRMPKMSGFQVFQILTALKPSIKTLFVSALDHTGEVLAQLRGIEKENDFIRKPVSRENFVCAVNKKIKLYA